MTFEVKRQTNTTFSVETLGQSPGQYRNLTVATVLKFAKEAQEAVDAGMDPNTEVRVHGSQIAAKTTVTQPIL